MQVQPTYEDYQRVLLIGEADFSFTRAFATELADRAQPIEITTTEYGDETDIATRYYEGDQELFAESISSLLSISPSKNIDIICGLNARQLGDLKCSCHRWNMNKKCWDAPSLFWNHTTAHNLPKYDLVIFNFPHSDQAGRAAKLIRAFFKQVRICVNDGRLPQTIVVEMRLRILETNPKLKRSIRSYYKHEEAAEESQFELIGNWPSDLHRWERLEYSHKWTKKNASCRDMGLNCKVWRWKPVVSSFKLSLK